MKNSCSKEVDEFKNIKLGFVRASMSISTNYLEGTIYRGPELAHYTNLDGLKGIVESNGLWMSDHRFLNDMQEYNDGVTFLKNIVKGCITEEKYLEFNGILENLLKK